MLVAVAGGNLQGVEAAYLSRKAGWDVLVIDRKPKVPATGLCHSFAQLDMTAEKDLAQALSGVDLVIPALENDAALACLGRVTRNKGIPFAFDPAAYAISSSKIKSEQLFKQTGAPTPARWPACKFPVVAKPDHARAVDSYVSRVNAAGIDIHQARVLEQQINLHLATRDLD